MQINIRIPLPVFSVHLNTTKPLKMHIFSFWLSGWLADHILYPTDCGRSGIWHMGSFPWDKCSTSPNNQKGKCVYPWESTLTMYHHVPTRYIYIYIWPNYSATWKNILPFKQNPSLSYKDSAFLPVFFGPGTATQIEDTRHTTSSWLFKPHPKKYAHQNGNLPQIGVKIETILSCHPPDLYQVTCA